MLDNQKQKTLFKSLSYRCFYLLVVTILLLPAHRAYSFNGECGPDFLNITVGAYSASMGQANYAGMEGAEAVFGNPSLLGENLSGFVSYQYLIMDTRMQAASVNIPIQSNYSVALGIDIFDPGSISGYDDSGNPTGGVGSGDQMIRLSMASRSSLSYGFSLSYYEQKLADVVGRGYGFGFGLSGYLGSNRIGLTVDNVGPEFEIGTSSTPLPSKFALSGWFPIHSRFINLSTDLIYSMETGIRLVGGFEYSPGDGLFFRAGGNNDVPLSLGFGLSSGSFILDYSYVPSDLFGDRHLFSFSIER